MKSLLVLGILALVLLVSGCSEEPLCQGVYYEYKTGECCLDKDSNQVCDKDEITEEPGEIIEEEPIELKEPLVESSQEEFIKNLMNNVVKLETELGNGSGFFVNNEGYVITNHHVIQGYENGEKNVTIKSYDSGHSSNYNARVLGYDYAHDIAVLKVDSKRNWKYFSFIDSIKVGDVVYALGSPFEYEFSASKGIISAKNRAGLNDKTVKDYLQTDAAINPGNSGGSLVNEDGKVVGLNTWKRGGIFTEGLGFALESKKIQELYNNIRYIYDTYGIPTINKVSREDFNEKIKLYILNFQILWDKNNGKGNFFSFDCNAENKDSEEHNICFNITIINGGLIIENKFLDKQLKLKTILYQPSTGPISVNIPFEKEGNYYFEVETIDCDSKEIYSKSLLTKAYYKKGEVILEDLEEGDSEFVFGRAITVEKIKYHDSKSYSVDFELDGVKRRIGSGNNFDIIGDIEVRIDDIYTNSVTLKVSY